MRWSRVALALVLVFCTLKAARFTRAELLHPAAAASDATPRADMQDFKVYYTAAALVREGRSLLIYNGADTGVDPQLRFADPQSVFGQQASRLGIPKIRMYVYPPVLADMLVPLSRQRISAAIRTWFVINALCVALVCWLCIDLLGLRSSLVSSAVLVLGAVTFFPLLDAFRWGQIVVVLLTLWTLGVVCYARGWKVASALALALATAIKLTPLLAIVPFVIWRDWRWLRAYALGLLAVFLVVTGWNGIACLDDCFRHVIPAMSAGIASIGNRSVMAVCQLLYVLERGGNPNVATHGVPAMVGTLGKVLGLLCVGAAAALIWRFRRQDDLGSRVVTLSLLPLLSTLISPVSWEHAYAVALLPYAVLWAEALRQRVPGGYLALLTVCSVELNWFSLSYALRLKTHGAVLGTALLLPIACGIALVIYRLLAMSHFGRLRSEPAAAAV